MFRMKFGRKVTFKKSFLSTSRARKKSVSQLLRNYIMHKSKVESERGSDPYFPDTNTTDESCQHTEMFIG